MACLHHLTQSSCSSANIPLTYGIPRASASLSVTRNLTQSNIRSSRSRKQAPWPTQHSTLACSAASGPSADSIAADNRPWRDSTEGTHDSLSRDEVERRVKKAANLMIAGNELAPFDRRTYNPALVLWCAPCSFKCLP